MARATKSYFHLSYPPWVHSWSKLSHGAFSQSHAWLIFLFPIGSSSFVSFNLFWSFFLELLYDQRFLFDLIHLCWKPLNISFFLQCLFVHGLVLVFQLQEIMVQITSSTAECQLIGEPVATCMITFGQFYIFSENIATVQNCPSIIILVVLNTSNDHSDQMSEGWQVLKVLNITQFTKSSNVKLSVIYKYFCKISSSLHVQVSWVCCS